MTALAPRLFAVALFFGCTGVLAESDHHQTSDKGIAITHAWTAATTEGTTLVFFEIENTTLEAVTLTGASSDIATLAEIVVIDNAAGLIAYTAIPGLAISANSRIALEPQAGAIRLDGLMQPLEHGDTFHLSLQFSNAEIEAAVAVEPNGSSQHSHAGHHH